MLGELSAEQIEAVLHAEVIARLGCISDGRVYVVPVSYVYDGTYIWGHGMDGAKLRAMREHPKDCFELEQVEDLTNWRSVIARGSFQVCRGQDRDTGMALLVERIMPLLKFPPHQPAPNPPGPKQGSVYRIMLTDKTGRFEEVSVD